MRSRFRPLVSLVLSAALLLGCVGCGGSAKAPTTITVWNYYSGDLLSRLQRFGEPVQRHRRQREEHRD